MLAFLLVPAALVLQIPDTAHLLIVATTDVHGHATEWDYVANAPFPGGLARAATVLDSLRARYPDQVVLVDAGDATEGDPLADYFGRVEPREPHPSIDAMNLLGYDAATPGDHDFDLGVASLTHVLAGATFPIVSGNLRVPEGRDTLAYAPYTIIHRQGVRIGVAGFTTPGVMIWSADKMGSKLRVARLAQSAGPVLSGVRKDADFVIVLAHSGLDGPSTYDTAGVGPENAAAQLSSGEVRPDLVVVGHTHRELIDSVLNGVHFVQPKPFAQSLSAVRVTLVPEGSGWRVVRIKGESIPLGRAAASPRVTRRLAEAHQRLLRWLNAPIGRAGGRLSAAAARAEDTPIIQFINEAQRKRAGADLSATPVLDPRASFEEGEITAAQVFGLYPASYTLRAVRINGDQLTAYLEQSARYFYSDSTGRIALNAYVPGYNFDVVSGVTYAIDVTQPPGHRIRDLTFRGRPVQSSDSFVLALSSYRQNGGGAYAALRNAPVVYDRNENIRDVLIDAVKSAGVLRPEAYARPGWRIVPEPAARAIRALFVRGSPPPAQARRDSTPLRLTPRRDSLLADSMGRRARARAESTALAMVATIKLPLARTGADPGLGELIADAYRNGLRTDLAIVSTNEMIADLPAGPVTQPQIESAISADHRLIRISMTGADLQWVFEHLVEGDTVCCHLAGAVLTYDPKAKMYERVRSVVLLPSRKRIESKRTYTLAVSDQLTGGGTFALGASECAAPFGCARSGLLGRWPFEDGGSTTREALVAYLRRLPQPVTTPEDRRQVPRP